MTDRVTNLAVEYLQHLGHNPVVEDDGLHVGDGRVFGTEPLRRRLAAIDPDRWAQAVADHFDTLLAVGTPDMPESFDQARSSLRLAVLNEAELGLFDGAIEERTWMAGLADRLMLRKGELGMTVTTKVVEDWPDNPGIEAVYAEALVNTLTFENFQVVEFKMFTSIRGGRWTSTNLRDLSRWIPNAPYGALVMAPARDEVIYHVIEGEEFTAATMVMMAHAVDAYQSSPLPIGCDLYWWDPANDRLNRIAKPDPERGAYRYIRVPEFSAMLWRLEEAIGA